MVNKKKIVKHLKGDIETFKHEAAEDRKLIKSIKKTSKKKPAAKKRNPKRLVLKK